MYELDFVGRADGPRLRYAEGVMPYCDGLVQVVESNPGGTQEGSVLAGGGKKSWYDNGVDVSVFLEKGAMERMLGDEELRKYDY